MHTIKTINLKDEILKLNNDERIFIDVDKTICNKIKLIDDKTSSCEALFRSFIEQRTAISCELNLLKFIDVYTNLKIEKADIIKDALLSRVGTDIYCLITSREYSYTINLNINKIIIFKKKNDCTCN